MIVQFQNPPSTETLAVFAARGAKVLANVPDNGVLVKMDSTVALDGLGLVYVEVIDAAQKLSPLISVGNPTAGTGYYLIEFHPDVDMNFARALILNVGVGLRENPDLAPVQLMVQVPNPQQALDALEPLAERDEVAYIFPASQALIAGTPVSACPGALTTLGPLGQLIALNGPGWEPTGQTSTTLSYVFGQMTAQLATGVPQSEILRAFAEWSKVIQLTWQAGTDPAAERTVDVYFAKGAHGDGYPFTGPGGVLAHTFYPAPPNPEPIAGDMHFNDDETWRVGVNTDLFSVALHETGHALGLGHSDNPNDVMYPYYKIVTTLAAGDQAAILMLYAAAAAPPVDPAPGPGPAPPGPGLTLTVNVPPATTTAPSISLSGTAAGGTGATSVTWVSSTGASGVAVLNGSAWSASISLSIGINNLTITASDSTGGVSQAVSVTRQAVTTPIPGDKTPPTLNITSPGSTSVATSLDSLNFIGTASDNGAVASVTWTTNTGSAGTATGTTQWSATIPLLVGSNTVTLLATDASGNTGWRTVVVTRR
jgi:hypothetical protein